MGSIVREWAIVEDASPDIGSSSAEQIRTWLEGFLLRVPVGHDPRKSWERAEEETKAAVWANWERLRGKSAAQRGHAAALRHNARVRAKHPLFAEDAELLASIGVALKDPACEAQHWERKARARFDVGQRRRSGDIPTFGKSLREDCQARLLAQADVWEEGARALPLNACRVWGYLHRFGAPPDVSGAYEQSLRLWPTASQRLEQLARIRIHLRPRFEYTREEARQVSCGALTDRVAMRELRTSFLAAWSALGELESRFRDG